MDNSASSREGHGGKMNFLNHRYCAALTLIPGRKMAPQTGTFMASNEALTRFQSASRSRQLHKHILFHQCCEKGILFSWSGLWRKRHKFKLTTSVSCEGRKYKQGVFDWLTKDKPANLKENPFSVFRKISQTLIGLCLGLFPAANMRTYISSRRG